MGLLGFEKSFQEGKQQVVLACLANFETNDRWPPALVWKPPSAEIVKGRLTWHVTWTRQAARRAYNTCSSSFQHLDQLQYSESPMRGLMKCHDRHENGQGIFDVLCINHPHLHPFLQSLPSPLCLPYALRYPP